MPTVVKTSALKTTLEATKPSTLINQPMTTTAPNQGSLLGNATWINNGAGNSYLQLTSATNSQTGQIEFNGALPTNFDVNFDLFISSFFGADALYFYWGCSSTATDEDGNYGGYVFAFDEYNGENHPYRLQFQGSELSFQGSVDFTNQFNHATIKVRGNTVTVFLNGVQKFTYTDSTRTLGGTKFGWGARTGGVNAEHDVRNIVITNPSDNSTVALLTTLEATNNNIVLQDDYVARSPQFGSATGTASWQSSGYVQLTQAVNNQSGYVEYSGNLPNNYIMQFDFRIPSPGADAVYFYWGDSSVPFSFDSAQGGYHFVVNNYSGAGQVVQIFFNGSIIGTYSNPFTYDNNVWHTFKVIFRSGLIYMYIDNVLLLAYDDTVNWPRSFGGNLFGLGARTGGVNSEHDVRNFVINQLGNTLALRADFTINSNAVTVGDTAQNIGINVSTLSLSKQIFDGDDALLVIANAGDGSTFANSAPSSVTYAGRSLTKIGERSTADNGARVSMWILYNPPRGTANVVGTWGGNCDHSVYLGGISLKNIAQNLLPEQFVVYSDVQGGTVTHGLKTQNPNDIVIDTIIGSSSGETLTVGSSPQVQIFSDSNGGSPMGVSKIPEATALSNANFQWTKTLTGRGYAWMAASFAPNPLSNARKSTLALSATLVNTHHRVVATDNFNRADSSNLGSNWTTGVGGHSPGILSNRATNPVGGVDCNAYWSANTFFTDQYAQAQLIQIDSGIDDFSGPIVRATSTDQVELQINKNANAAQIIWYNSGAFTMIGSQYVFPSDPTGGIFLLEAVGHTFTAYLNGMQIIQGTNNSAPTTGSAGIKLGSTNANQALWDNWEGGDYFNAGTVALFTSLIATKNYNVAIRTILETAVKKSTVATIATLQQSFIAKGTVALSATLQQLHTGFLREDWNSGSISGSKWNNWGGGQSTIVSKQLQIASTLGGGYYGVGSVNALDLTGSEIRNQLVDVGSRSITSWEVYPVYVSIFGDNTNQLYFFIDVSNNLRAYKKVSGTTTVIAFDTYNAALHQYFRIRESLGTIYWETSPDGFHWNAFGSTANPFAINSVEVGQQVGTWQAEGSTTHATFDNFNLLQGSSTLALDTVLETAGVKSTVALSTTFAKQKNLALLTTLSKPAQKTVALFANLSYRLSTLALRTTLEISAPKDIALKTTLEKSPRSSTVAMRTTLETAGAKRTVALFTSLIGTYEAPIAILTTLEVIPKKKTLALKTVLEANKGKTVAIRTTLEKTIAIGFRVNLIPNPSFEIGGGWNVAVT